MVEAADKLDRHHVPCRVGRIRLGVVVWVGRVPGRVVGVALLCDLGDRVHAGNLAVGVVEEHLVVGLGRARGGMAEW